jgi:hypothetical protein
MLKWPRTSSLTQISLSSTTETEQGASFSFSLAFPHLVLYFLTGGFQAPYLLGGSFSERQEFIGNKI